MKGLTHNSKVFFEDISHSYWTEDGRCLKGVTTLMREQGLSPDYGHISADTLAKAAERGTAVHKAIENYCKGQEYERLPEVELFANQGFDVLANEYLVSDNKSIASSIDIVLADYSLCDIKTTSTLHLDAVKWQLSIYAYLFELQNPDKKVPALYAIHFNRKKMKIAQLQRIDNTEIEALIEANINAQRYTPQGEQSTNDDNIIPADYSKAYSLMKSVDDMKQQIKAAEEQINIIKQSILDAMTENNINVIENEYFKVTRINESTRTSIDAAKLSELYPDAYNDCKKEIVTAASVRLTMRK